ncbi:MAG: ABC transporter permease [Solirubrobacteraceae bacterium]
MTGRRAVWEVARREVVERSRSRVLRISLALLLLFSVGGAIAAARVKSGTPTDDVGLVGPRSVALEPAITAQARVAGRRIRLKRLAGAAAARRALRDGAIDVALLDGRAIVVKRSRTAAAVRVVQDGVAAQAALDRLRAAGISNAQAIAALAPRPLPVAVLEPGAAKAQRNRDLVAIGLVVLLMALLGFGQMVASSVIEEKSSRVVELLLTTLSPRHLLAGKVLGIGALGLGQLLLAGAAALVAGRLAGGAGLPSAAPEAIVLVVLWFVLGYALFSAAYAAVGALISRHEDLDTAAAPITMVVLIAFYVAILVALQSPNGTLARVAAFVPPLAPMVVPARVALGDMGVAELGAAIALDLLATAALILLAARIYERAILRIGAPVKLRRALWGRSRPGAARPREGATADLLLRGASVALIVAGGLLLSQSTAAAIGLIALGLLLTAVRRMHTHRHV